MNYQAVIGIEIHLELLTESKMFSSSKSDFSGAVNTNIGPLDLGYPGTLPSVNKKAVEQGIKIAKVLNCKIDDLLRFDRKNYFYPDLPKGYQITQEAHPLGHDGFLEIDVNGSKKRIGIARIHLEEDTAKQIHTEKGTLLDYNRCGVPLAEIVTDASFDNPEEVEVYLTKIKNLVEYIGVSDARMEEGSMRCDANISLMPKGSKTFGTRVEVKNINSISNVRKALEYEIERQEAILNKGEMVKQETRRYDDQAKQTIFMRAKTDAVDYKYFPEANIFPIRLDRLFIENAITSIGLLPEEKIAFFIEQGLTSKEAELIVYNRQFRVFLQEIEKSKSLKGAVKLLFSDVLAYLNANNKELLDTKLTAAHLISLADAFTANTVSNKHTKLILTEMIEEGLELKDILSKHQLVQVSDEGALREIAAKIVAENPNAIEDIRNGRDKAYQFLVGQMFKATKGQAAPQLASRLIQEEVAKLL